MKEVLKKLRVLEAEMEEAENQSEYWMEEEHLDTESQTATRLRQTDCTRKCTRCTTRWQISS